ncbi:MAG: Hemoglobin-like protein HbO, partial [uncultured Frankineae bacterium]
DQPLRRGRRGAGVPPAGGGLLRRRGAGPGAASALPGRPRPGRGPAADVPGAVLGRSDHLLRAARAPPPADAARRLAGRHARARRLAGADGRRRRAPGRPGRRARGDLGPHGTGRVLAGQPPAAGRQPAAL